MNSIKGLTMTFVFEAESANYGEGIGNVTSLKKLSRDSGRAYTYISRQALRYNIINQMGCDNTPLDLYKDVIQFAPDATIKDYPEIDLFGYMKTIKPTRTRPAVTRLSNAIALETFNADLDFLTNKNLLDRYNEDVSKKKNGSNISQSEIHKSYYSYTITIDLDKVGIDKNDKIKKLLDAVKFLYRDIKGRRENLSPIFAIGGVYSIKNPFFENRVKCYNNMINIEAIKSVLNLDKEISDNTNVGLINGIFRNNDELINELNAIDMSELFDKIKGEVDAYYKE